MADGGSRQGIGARVLRKEDKRFLDGAGRYVSDIYLPRTLEAAIVRSPVAHAENLRVSAPEDAVGRCQATGSRHLASVLDRGSSGGDGSNARS